ncbi:MAG: TonB-dependent receptor [Proteobacteria bacterium]|nr:TonB-dependent receptor [Pseudomonadota bacterium]
MFCKKNVIRKINIIIIVCVLFYSVSVWGSEPSKVLHLDDIIVSEKAESVSMPPPSSTIIGSDEIEKENYDKTLYILQKVPGVVIQDYGQGAVASQFTMRGLRLGHNTGVAIFVDGVPLNESTSHGDGYGDFNTIIPEDINYIEVIKGPASALYGQFARAGVVNIITKRSGDFALYKFGAGDFDKQRFAASVGHDDGNISSVIGAELSRSEGATDHSDWKLGNATGKFTYDFNKKLKGGLTVNLHSTEWDHPEYLTREQWDAHDYWSAKSLGSGERHRYGVNTNWTYDVADNAFANLLLYGYTMNLTRYRDMDTYVREEYHDRDMYGGSASYVWATDFNGMGNNLTVGVDGQVELTHTLNASNPSRIPSAREIITVDGDSTINTLSGYFQNQFSPSQAWRISLGLRYDHINGDLDDNLTGIETSMGTFEVISPKAGLEFTPIDGYTLFATYGEGFKLPGGFDKFTYPDLTEETYKQYELGIKFMKLLNFESTLTGFILDVQDEIVTDSAAGTKENQGETRRKGVELEVNYAPVDHLSIFGNASYTKGKYRDYVNNGIDYSDTDISLVPDWLFSFGARWKPPEGLFAGFDYRYVGEADLEDYPSNYTGNQKTTIDYWVANAQIGYQWNQYSLTLDIKNAFDKRYPSTESASSLRTANPRAFFVTFAMSY